MSVRTLLTGLFGLLGASLSAQLQEVQIGLLHDMQVKRAIALFGKGGALIQADGVRVGELAPNDGLRIEAIAGGISGKSLAAQYTAKDRLTLIPKSQGGGFQLRALDNEMNERMYPGWLEARMVNGKLVLVCQTKLEEYVAGVVQSEAGKQQHLEYYKLQAVSCRTYALANLRKHAADGFELCEGTHCQVFNGRADHEPILAAARATRGMVAVDASIRLIQATFHSNCGGETMNAEDVWSKAEPYLRATTDSFCLHAPHATWKRSIGRSEWLAYLQRKYGVAIDDQRVQAAVTEYAPPCRELYLAGVSPLIPIEQVRDDWKLKSAFFSIGREGDAVVFTGRGFGHGVGLCQEGAMQMARTGQEFGAILHHYYADVHLVDLSSLDFFRDEGE